MVILNQSESITLKTIRDLAEAIVVIEVPTEDHPIVVKEVPSEDHPIVVKEVPSEEPPIVEMPNQQDHTITSKEKDLPIHLSLIHISEPTRPY